MEVGKGGWGWKETVLGVVGARCSCFVELYTGHLSGFANQCHPIKFKKVSAGEGQCHAAGTGPRWTGWHL